MNLKVLSKLYDQLTARERLPLLIAAAVHGDAVDRRRLLDSAPTEPYAISHHHILARALDEATTIHLMTLLDVAASSWQWWGLWGWHQLKSHRPTVADQAAVGGADGPADEEAEGVRNLCMVRYQAYLLHSGWRTTQQRNSRRWKLPRKSR